MTAEWSIRKVRGQEPYPWVVYYRSFMRQQFATWDQAFMFALLMASA